MAETLTLEEKWLAYAERKIDVFAAAMKQEMRANRAKGHWFLATPEELLHDAHYHMAKLHVAIRRPGLLGDPCTCVPQSGADDYDAPQHPQHDPDKCAGNDPVLEFASDVANLLMMAMERSELLGLFDFPPEVPNG